MFLIPSSMQPGEITRVLREGYDAQRLTEGIRALVASCRSTCWCSTRTRA